MAAGGAATLPADAALPVAAAAANHPCSCRRRCRETHHGAAADVAQNHRCLPTMPPSPTMMLRRLAAAEEGRHSHVRRRPLRCQIRRRRSLLPHHLPPLPPLVQTLWPAVEITQKSCRTVRVVVVVVVVVAAAAVVAVAGGDEGPGWQAAMPR